MRRLLLALALLSTACSDEAPSEAAPEAGAEAAAPTAQAPSPAPESSVILPDFDADWNYGDPAGTRKTFLGYLMKHTTSHGTDPEPGPRAWRLELQTQIARTHGLEKDFERGHIVLNQVDVEVKALGDSSPVPLHRVRVRSLLERGRLFNSAGDKEKARPLFEEAWEEAREQELDGLAVDAAHMVAIAAMGTDDELTWGRRALALAESSEQPAARKWQGSLLNNIGWTLHDQGDIDGALALWEKQIGVRTAAGKEPALRIARWTHARGLRSAKRHEEALAALDALVKDYGEEATSDGFVSEERCENLLALGRDAEARPLCAKAAEQLKSTYVKDSEPERIARLESLGS